MFSPVGYEINVTFETVTEAPYTLEKYYYKVVQIWPGQTVTCLHTNSPGHI
jgi:hypothetical protein